MLATFCQRRNLRGYAQKNGAVITVYVLILNSFTNKENEMQDKKNSNDYDFSDTEVMTAAEIAVVSKDMDATINKVQDISGASLQKTQTTYTTAVTVPQPRILAEVKKRVLQEVELDPGAMFYSWPVKGKGGPSVVKGGSIGLAMSIARNYGNCAIPVVAEENPTYILFRAAFIDLETGFTIERMFRQRKKQDIGKKYDSDRAEDMTFQIGQSKAIRNVVLKGVPVGILNSAISKAMDMVREEWTTEKFDGMKKRMLTYFKSMKVTEKMLGDYLNEPDSERWTVDMMVSLGSVRTTIENEGMHPSEFFEELKKQDSKKEKPSSRKTTAKKEPKPAETEKETTPDPEQKPDESKESEGQKNFMDDNWKPEK